MGTDPLLQPSPPFPFIKKPILLRTTYCLIIPLALLNIFIFSAPPSNPPPLHKTAANRSGGGRRCDFADGRWVPDPGVPQYNDTSCTTIKSGQNCMAQGRPDTGYLHWRWQPAACRLPAFSGESFLRLLANKHIAFVGDSLARNQMESLLCLLSTASGPPDLIYRRGDEDKFRRWVFPSHNATVSIYWSPFLVKGVEKSFAEGKMHNKLYLDTADERWAAELGGIDVVVFSAGHWFLLPGVFYGGGGEVFGCHHCAELNLTDTGFFHAFRMAVRTAVTTAVRKLGQGKMAAVTTFSPAHFEGEWDKAGACERKEPFREGEKEMEYMDREMWKIELEEAAAAAAGASPAARVEVLDVTRMAVMRPDGHPGPYMHAMPFAGGGGVKERVQNDCVHWCLPGPIDAWNEILLVLMGMWREGWELVTSL
ncbi:hypothetical protein KSP39_PZI003720 [Platanthera zijinensis]|uniref:Trichome birefringence-like N-terminal domain-containing protein n=1 Tax=Platanthera zijinensis TaxID=2320716 RepID=A0AAP0GCR9_9ASPA